MNLLFWNVEGLTQYKLDDADFRNVFIKYHVIMLVETWTNKLSNIDIPNYKHFALHRPRRKARAKRDSGGLIVYIRNDVLPGFELLDEDPHDCMWFKIKKGVILIYQEM